jgi:hypothetical protein
MTPINTRILEDVSTVRRPPVQFTIRSFMLAVATAAGLLAASVSPTGLVVAFGLTYLLLIGATWWIFHGFRRLSALCFGVVASLNNILSAGLCIHRLNMGGIALMLLASLLASPIVFGAGAAWATAVMRRAASPHRSRFLAWPLVLALAILPFTMLLARWPFHLAFLASTPALDRLADRVAAGQSIASPEWAGLFRVVGSAVDPSTGNIGLIIDPNLSGRSGFVRVGAALGVSTGPSSGPFYNLDLDLTLGDRWRYQCED